MNLPEKLLLLLSKNNKDSINVISEEEWTIDNALTLLGIQFPGFLGFIKGKNVLDFGSGDGFQSVCLAQNGAKCVLGIETSDRRMHNAEQLSKESAVNGKLKFRKKLEVVDYSQFDVVISQNSFEHFANPSGTLNLMKEALSRTGKLFITFGPPWFAPYGAHMRFFLQVPWANILFSEKTIMNVRSLYKEEFSVSYKEVGLNMMTVKRFEDIIANSGMDVEFKRYCGVKGIGFLTKIPFIRELFINQISCILTKK